MLFLLITLKFGNCLILKTLFYLEIPWTNRSWLFSHFNIIILSTHILTSRHQRDLLSFLKGKRRKQILLYLQVASPPSQGSYIFLHILPCWKGPVGWCPSLHSAGKTAAGITCTGCPSTVQEGCWEAEGGSAAGPQQLEPKENPGGKVEGAAVFSWEMRQREI